MEDLGVVTSDDEDGEENSEKSINNCSVDQTVDKTPLQPEPDVRQSVGLDDLVIKEVWTADEDGDGDDDGGVVADGGGGGAHEQGPAEGAPALRGEGVQHRDVTIDADDGDHHHRTGEQNLRGEGLIYSDFFLNVLLYYIVRVSKSA